MRGIASKPSAETESPHNRERGRAAESLAATWLEERGYRIEERNHSNPVGEIDLIAWCGDVLCFIEIKSRDTDGFGRAIEAVDRAKQRQIGRVASLYLVRYEDSPPICRFDVVGMDREAGEWRYTLIQDAFNLDS